MEKRKVRMDIFACNENGIELYNGLEEYFRFYMKKDSMRIGILNLLE
ncbi:MAG: hypothetical protein IPL67_06425 [Ignavibacteria bacterium]|nr:hypothetical protein [Ignavibacteria bacterium]